MNKYSITYWGRRGDEGYDWITDHFYGDTEEDAIEEVIKTDISFNEPFEILEIYKIN